MEIGTFSVPISTHPSLCVHLALVSPRRAADHHGTSDQRRSEGAGRVSSYYVKAPFPTLRVGKGAFTDKKGQATTCTTSPLCSVVKYFCEAAAARWMQPCEYTERLPVWNAIPGRKNTEFGIGASNCFEW